MLLASTGSAALIERLADSLAWVSIAWLRKGSVKSIGEEESQLTSLEKQERPG